MKLSVKTKEKLIVPIITLVITLVSVYFGQYLSQQSAENLFHLKNQRELRIKSYTKLLGLKIPWNQTILTHMEALVLSDYYYARYQVLTHDPNDLEEAKRQNDRALNLIPEIGSLGREVLECVAEIQICYNPTDELNKSLDHLINYKAIKFKNVDRGTINTLSDLENWKNRICTEISDMCNIHYENRIDSVLPHLISQLRNE